MLKSLHGLDYSEMFASGTRRVWVTLSYPGDWQDVAPNAVIVAKHRESLFDKIEVTFGSSLMLIWKLEFGSRGAPHFHMLIHVPEGVVGDHHRRGYEHRKAEWEAGYRSGKPRWRKPKHHGLTFEEWLPKAWAGIVNHPDPVQRAYHERAGAHIDSWDRDGPEEAIAYFSKHQSSGKGYQNLVPELWKNSTASIGRVWGRRGLEPVEVSREISETEFHAIARVLRRKKRRVRRWDEYLQEHVIVPALAKVRRPRGPVIRYELDEKGVPQPVQRGRWMTVRKRTTSHTGAGQIFVENGADTVQLLYEYIVGKTAPKSSPADLPVGLRGSIKERFPSLFADSVGEGECPSGCSRT